jgi:TPR repeat protein
MEGALIYRQATVLLNGDGGAHDKAAARTLFEAAANLGNAAAMNMAGLCLDEGWGDGKD